MKRRSEFVVDYRISGEKRGEVETREIGTVENEIMWVMGVNCIIKAGLHSFTI
jgi:hypothetical protein